MEWAFRLQYFLCQGRRQRCGYVGWGFQKRVCVVYLIKKANGSYVHCIIDTIILTLLMEENCSFFLYSQRQVSFEPTTTYLLKELKPFTTYTFRLAARSKHGVGAYTNEISAETPQTRRCSSLSKFITLDKRNTFSNATAVFLI